MKKQKKKKKGTILVVSQRNMAQWENANTKMFYLLKNQKKKGTILVFSQRTVVRVL